MSINHFMNKIKGKSGIDGITFMCLFIIVLVGISSYGLGRLSVIESDNSSNVIIKDNNIPIDNIEYTKNSNLEGKTNLNIQDVKEKMYVASKNGKLYYSIGCSGAKRISTANQVWFASSVDAEKSGYILSTSCK